MGSPLTVSESPSSSEVLTKVTNEFAGFLDKINKLQAEKAELAQKLKEAEAEAKALTPQLLAKFHKDAKELAAQEAALLSQRKEHLQKYEKAKAEFDKVQADFSAYEAQVKAVIKRAEDHAALFFAKTDAYAEDLKRQAEKSLELAKSEQTKASTERQAADDFLKRAEEQLKKVQDNGKAQLEKIEKAEKAHEIKLAALKGEILAAEKQKAALDKDVQYLRDLYEKRKQLEEGLHSSPSKKA